MTGFPAFGDTTFPNYIESFTLASSGDKGSLNASGNVDYDSALGARIGTTITDGSTLSWDNTFATTTHSLDDGFSVSFDVEKGIFAGTIGGQAENRTLFLIDGTEEAAVSRQLTNTNWTILNDGTPTFTGYVTRHQEYTTKVRVDISFDPTIGSFGNIKVWANRYPLIDQDLSALPDFDSGLNLSGLGTAGFPNISQRFSNVQLIGAPLSFDTVNKVRLSHMGDSWIATYGQQELGGANDTPVLTGYQGTEDSSSYLASASWKNTAYVAQLTNDLIEKGIYPDGAADQMGFYGQDGGLLGDSGAKPFDERVDACLAPQGSAGTPFPFPGQGSATTEVYITHVGTNSVSGFSNAQMDGFFADFEVNIDRLITAGGLVVVDLITPRYDGSSIPQDVDEVDYMNGLLSSLEGRRNACTVNTEVNTLFAADATLANEIHPSRTGQVVWAQTVASAIERVLNMAITILGNNDNTNAVTNAVNVSTIQTTNFATSAPLAIDRNYRIVRYGIYGESLNTTTKTNEIYIYDHDGVITNLPGIFVTGDNIEFTAVEPVDFYFKTPDSEVILTPAMFPSGFAVVALAATGATARVYKGSSGGSNAFIDTTGVSTPAPDPFPVAATSLTESIIIFVELEEIASGVALTSDLTRDLTSNLTFNLTG
jgi:hypothetical protein